MVETGTTKIGMSVDGMPLGEPPLPPIQQPQRSMKEILAERREKKKAWEENKKILQEEQKNKELELRIELDKIKERQKGEQGQIKALFEINKEWGKRVRRLRMPKQPVVFLLRNWKDIEIFEGVRGNTFIIPQAEEHKGALKLGDELTKKPYNRTVHLSPSDLFTIPWGNETVKGYVVSEDDAMPVGANIQVWSERLEYTLDALLLNFEKYKRGIVEQQNKWIVDLVKYGGIIFLGYMIIKFLFFNEPPTPQDVTTVVQTLPADGATIL